MFNKFQTNFLWGSTYFRLLKAYKFQPKKLFFNFYIEKKKNNNK
jgi:hypothetical protein